MTPPRPRPPRDLDPRRVADARAGLASASRSSATIPFLVAAASRHSTARGSGRFATFVRAELSLGSRKTPRLLRFVPKLAYGLGSGRLNATTRAGASFSAPPDARGAGRSEDIDARFAASALCFPREGRVRSRSRHSRRARETAKTRRGEETPGLRKIEAREVGVDARNPCMGVERRSRDAPQVEARKARAVSCRRSVSWTGAGTAWTASRVGGGSFRERVFASRAEPSGVGFFGASKKRPGASRGANRDAKLSTHLVVVVDVDVDVVFSRALRLKMTNAEVVNRRSRGASRDGGDRRGIGRAMSRRELSCARNEKVDCPVRRGRTVLRAVLGVFARRSRPPSSAGRCGCVRGGGWDQERGERVRSAY